MSSCILAEENTSRIKEIPSLTESSGNRHIHFSESAQGETFMCSFLNPTLSSQLVFFSRFCFLLSYVDTCGSCFLPSIPFLWEVEVPFEQEIISPFPDFFGSYELGELYLPLQTDFPFTNIPYTIIGDA